MSPAKKKSVQIEPSAPVPFNRKYRPQSFDTDELVGQEHIVRTLRNAVRSNRIASAYLFCGPRGTGKTSTARILAKAVNCLEPDPDKRPCNRCSSCTAINTGATPDVIEIDAASNRGIDDIRDLRDRVNYAPTQLRTKFYIIDEAHQITGAAANAFLKTLEEPPSHTKFILATTDPEELLPTIVSRCQRFDFRRHTPGGIAGRITELAKREGINLSDDAIDLVADLAHGSMRDPIGLLDQLASYRPDGGDGELSVDDVRDLVGISHSEVAIRILVAISKSDPKAALETINEAVYAGQDPRQLNRQIVSLIRDGLYIASGARAVSDEPELKEACDRLGLNGLLGVAEAFADTDIDIRGAVIPQLPLEMAVLDAILGSGESPRAGRSSTKSAEATAPGQNQGAAIQPVATQASATASSEPRPSEPARDVPSRRLQDMVRKKPDTGASNSNAAAQTNDVVADSNGPMDKVTIEALVELWPKIRADIKSLDRRTEALLMEIDPIDVSADEIILAASYEFHRDKVNEDDRRAIVEQVIGRRTGRTLRVQCVLRSEFSPASRTAETGSQETLSVTEAGVKSPDSVAREQVDVDAPDERMLGAVVRMFDGEIIED